MVRSFAIGLALSMCGFLPLQGQDASPLESYFTGKEVGLKIDMPGTQMGVDLKFDKPVAMDWNEYSSRIKTYGVAIRKGDQVRITKFVEKKDRIEFQLAGGGFGTAGDDSSTIVSASYVPKSQYEKDLEKQIAATTDDWKKRDLQRDLDRERMRRQRQDDQNQNAAKVASQVKAQLVADKRLQGGSRFNLRWQGSIPSEERNPESVMRRLSEYVDFGGPPVVDRGPGLVRPMISPNSNPPLKRGMKFEEVSALLGQGRMVSDAVSNDGLRTQVFEYRTPDSLVDVTFVEGVVVRYSISSN